MSSTNPFMNRLIKHIRTPVIHSVPLSRLLGKGKNVFLKMDNAQLSGSFKDRGVANLIHTYTKPGSENKVRTLISSSAGNAGLAAAILVNKFNRVRGLTPKDKDKPEYFKCEVFVPTTATETAIQRMRDANATVIVDGPSLETAHSNAMKRVAELESAGEHCAFCHPYDNPLLWEGHSSIIEELMEDLKMEIETGDPCIVCSVGGGGLLNGLGLGLARHNLSDKMSVVTAETDGCHSFYLSNKAGKIQTLDRATSIANTLGATTPQSMTLEYSRKYTKETLSMIVTDKQAVYAMKQFLDDHRTLVEPACGAALALLYDEEKRGVFDPFNVIVVEVCGGNGISLAKLLELCEDFEIY